MKIKIFLITFIIMLIVPLLFNNVKAASYTATLDKDWNTDEVKCSITVESDGLSDGLTAYANTLQGCVIIDENYQIRSDYRYNYTLVDSGYNPVTSFNGETATITIYQENLLEGDRYDVYFLDGDFSALTVDETLNGTVAEVVNIGGTNYIQFTTTSMKQFALNQHVSEEYEEKLEEITQEGIYVLSAANPEGYEQFFDVWTYTETISSMEDYTIEPIYDYPYMSVTFDDIPTETHLVEYKYKEDPINSKIKNTIDDIFSSLVDENNPYPYREFTIEDLNYINYLYNATNGDEVIYYSLELRDTLKGKNFIPYFSYRMGDTEPFHISSGGMVTVMYNDILYPLTLNMGYTIKQVIYVPDDTEDTDAALIAAAKQRIIDYLGIDESDFTLTVGAARSTVGDDNFWRDGYDLDNISANYYNLTINGRTIKFVIEKNSEKATNPEFVTSDLSTDIQITSESGAIPLDTQINVNEILKDSNEFKEVMKKIEKETGLVFDLKLFSSSLDTYITKLDNGQFKVRIPLTNEFKGKDLTVYHIDEDDKIEEYEITFEEDGKFAVFTTDHFSTYTIAEKTEEDEETAENTPAEEPKEDTEKAEETKDTSKEETTEKTTDNPKTGDNIILFVAIMIISTLGLAMTIQHKKN